MSELDEYLASLPSPDREALTHLRDVALAAVPEAVPGRSYGMPALLYRGKALLAARQAAGHLGLYPFSPAAIDAVRGELAGFSLSKGTIRFTAAHPVPDEVLLRLLAARVAEIEAAPR